MLQIPRWKGRKTFVCSLILSCVIAAANSAQAQRNLVAHYTFDEGPSKGHVVDRVSKANDGTLYGAQYVKLARGYALAIGRTGMAKCASPREIDLGKRDFSIALWFKLDGFASGVLMGKKGQRPESRGWHIAFDGQEKRVAFNIADGKRSAGVGAPLADTSWHYLVAVRKGKTVALYLDGKPAASETRDIFGANVNNDKAFLFLGKIVGDFRGFDGKLDDVSIRRGALTAAQVASRYKRAKRNRPVSLLEQKLEKSHGLVLHYTFDRDNGAVAKDRSVFGHDGKLLKARYLPELDGRRGVLRFDGKDSALTCPESEALRFEGDMSFEMWARQNGTIAHSWGVFFGDGNDFDMYFAGYHSLVLWYVNRHPRYKNESMLLPVDRYIFSDKWSHIAVVVEYPRCRFYHNGKLIRDAYMPIPGIPNNVNKPFVLGRNLPMDLDEFRLYRRALTPAEVAAHARGEEVAPEETAELAIEPNWYENTVAMRLTCKGADYGGYTAEMAVLRKGSREPAVAPRSTAMSEAFGGPGRCVATVTFPLSDLRERSLDGVARILRPGGALVKEVRRSFFLKKPDWVNSQEGYSDKVLAPWTPVEADAKPDGAVEVGVWGRRYTFDRAPFPVDIQSAGDDLLTGPIALSGRVDGKLVAWREGRVALKQRSDKAAILEQTADAGAVTWQVNTTIEFDGYMIFDCELKARRNLSLDELSLQIPLRTKYAKLCYGDRVYPIDPANPEREMAMFQSGAVRGDLAFRFGPTVWLGNEDRGLCWQSETDQDWRYADRQKAIEILPRGDTTTFKARFVDVPTRLAAGDTLRYKFALQATPIKPLLRDSWDLRIVRAEPYGRDLSLPDRTIDGKPAIEYLVGTGMRRLFTTGCDMWPYPLPVHERYGRLLRRLNDAMHARGLKIHNYQIHERFPTEAPEFDIYGLNMANRPLRQYIPGNNPPGNPRPGPVGVEYGASSQGTVFFCAKSKALQDACVHALARRIDLYDDDGVYLDGTAQCPPCENLGHGCGYIAADGSIRKTFPVFAVREFMRRIYTVIKTRKPDGVVDVHCSFGYNIPALAYGDILWTGEQWYHLRHTGTDYIAGELILDKFRTEFMGSQAGLGAETLSYRLLAGGRRTWRNLLATTLLHDIPLRPSTPGGEQPAHPGKDYFQLAIKLWKLRDRFGAKEAEKLFYWKNAEYVKVSPEKCYVTLFKHPKNGVLAFISNLRRDARRVTVRFDLDKLNLNGRKLRVFNALDGTPVAMTADGEISLKLDSEDWAYIWLSPGAR